MRRKALSYYLFIVVLYLFTFQFALMDILQYWDEIYAILYVVLLCLNVDGKIRIKQFEMKVVGLLFLYVVIGIIPNIVYQYQNFSAVVIDILLNLKFFLGIYTTVFLFQKLDFIKYKEAIKKHVKIIISILFTLLLIDEIFEIFPFYEIRYGLRAEQLFFEHPTALASVSFFLVVLLMVLFSNKRKDVPYVVMGILLVLSSLRIKAIATAVIFLGLYYYVIIKKKQITIKHFLICVPLVIYIGWEQISLYYISEKGIETARNALTYKSLEIMKDYFPLGTGFGTFASAPSGDYYSPLYSMYGISYIWGLQKGATSFVSDTFWPMILGQTGFLGVIIYLILIFYLLRKIKSVFMLNKELYLAGLGSMLYLIVASTAESAFVNPCSLPLSVIIGIVFIEADKLKTNLSKDLV